MCGRFSLAINREEIQKFLKDEYQIDSLTEEAMYPKYNITPGQKVLSVLQDGTKFRAGMLRWGFLPNFAKSEEDTFKMINAKAETITEKVAFQASLERKRCVILADGFYEWKQTEAQKKPMRIVVKDRAIVPLAGIWSTFTRSDGTKLFTCAIVTTEANTLMSSIHTRMPVILSKEYERLWLDPRLTDPIVLKGLLVPYDPNLMKAYEVSSLVNKATNESPDCIVPV